MRLVIRTADQIVDRTPSDDGRQGLLVRVGLLVELLGHLLYVAVS